MKKRILSGLIGGALLIAILKIGGILLHFSVLIVSSIAIYEFNNALKKINNLKPISIVNYLLAFSFFIMNIINNNSFIQIIFFLYTITLLSMLVLNSKKTFFDVSATMLEGAYVAFLFYHISLLNGSIYLWFVFIIAIATDSFAYFIGTKFGKRKLCPVLSPKKSVEGSIAGILGSLIVTLIVAYVFSVGNVFKLGILSIICSIMAQIGDLTASKIKRAAGIKDYGNIMPGHGGVLDRFDSILFTAPIVYYYMIFFLK